MAAATVSASASIASAQSLADQTRALDRGTDGPSRVLSVNPFLPLLGFFSGEYEHRIGSALAFAVAASHIKPFNNTMYTNLDAKLRLYPSENGLRGFNVAASLGVAQIHDNDRHYACAEPVPIGTSSDSCYVNSKSFNTGSFAIEMGYQWLLGPSRSTALTVGGGAKRYFGSDSQFQFIEHVVPTLRLTIGYAF